MTKGGTIMTYKGIVRFSDLEGGHWTFECEDGTTYQLQGGDEGLRKDGQKVVVEGGVAQDMMGFGMTGPMLRVASYSVEG